MLKNLDERTIDSLLGNMKFENMTVVEGLNIISGEYGSSSVTLMYSDLNESYSLRLSHDGVELESIKYGGIIKRDTDDELAKNLFMKYARPIIEADAAIASQKAQDISARLKEQYK